MMERAAAVTFLSHRLIRMLFFGCCLRLTCCFHCGPHRAFASRAVPMTSAGLLCSHSNGTYADGSLTTCASTTSRRDCMGQCLLVASVLFAPLCNSYAANLPSAAKRQILMPVEKANFTSQFEPIRTRTAAPSSTTRSKPASATNATKIKPVNLTSVGAENTINITSYVYDETQRKTAAVYVDRKDFTIVTVKRLPSWIPKSWRPTKRIEIPNSQLLASAVIAGSVTEAIRTTTLHPLSTIKARIQANPKHRKARTWKRKLQLLYLSFRRHLNEGDLYAGLVPSLLVTVPASGVYCGVRDVSNRFLHGPIDEISPFADIEVALLGAFIADVAALSVRTPADIFTLRLQVQQMMPNQTKIDYRESLRDAIGLLPAAIITDIPYLLLRLLGNWLVTRGNEGLAQYEIETIVVACLCSCLTTPFDVARTRVFINDNSGDLYPRTKDQYSVIKTMINVTGESEAGIQNLYAGWLERTAYFGVGRAWFDPLRVIGYLGIRDAVLLKWFLK